MLEENIELLEPCIGKNCAVGIITYTKKPFYFYGILIGFNKGKLILQLKNGLKEIELSAINDVHTVPER